MAGKRANTRPWKHIYGLDRGYTRRKDAADLRAAAHKCGPTCKAHRAIAA